MLVGGLSITQLFKHSSRFIAVCHVVFWLGAAFIGFILANTALGDGYPPSTMTMILTVLAALSQVLLMLNQSKAPDSDSNDIDGDDTAA